MLQKFVIILADTDEQYVDRLTEFIKELYAPRIKVSSFTRIEELTRFWLTDGVKADAILINPDFLAELAYHDHGGKLIVLLSDGRPRENCGEYPSIYKFQSGDKLINQLIATFLEHHPRAATPRPWLSRSRLIAVYSPAGGVGKTSLSVGLAAELAEMGNAVLYLNIECISSTDLFLTCQVNYALTHVLLTLKEKPSLLPMKVERYRTESSEFIFQFLEPAENFLELSGLTGAEISLFLQTLQAADKYDYILVDTDSAASEKTLAVIGASETTFLVMTPDIVSRHKIKSFLSQAARAASLDRKELLAKMIPVINKHNDESCFSAAEGFGLEFGLQALCQIPFINNLWVEVNGQSSFDVNRSFRNSLGGLIRTVQKESLS